MKLSERDEAGGQRVIVRREGPTELGQARIAVRAVVQVAQHLVERTVLLHDVDHVLDPLAQEPHHPLALLVLVRDVEVVLRDLFRQVAQIMRAGHRRADQRRAFKLELVLVARVRRGQFRRVLGWVAARQVRRVEGQARGIGARNALAIDDVHPRAVGAERDVVRLEGRGDEAGHRPGLPSPQRNDGD
jgi:hypothetical protein